MPNLLLEIKLETLNEAFVEDEGLEISRILRIAANKFESGEKDFKLRDTNGNTVGEAKFTPV